jgi:dihydrofolate reductase
MGRLIVEQIVTVDGFAEDADGGISFFVAGKSVSGDDREQLAMLESVDAMVLGATTYRMFSAYWPNVTPDEELVAEPIARMAKHVVSNTLESAPWGDAEIEIERGDGAESVRALKQRYSGDLIVWGSLTLADALFEAGLVDVLRLRIVPKLLGSGRGTTPASLALTELELSGSEVHEGGAVTLQYAVHPAA